MAFARYVPEWSGFQGAPGYTVLNFVADTAVAADPDGFALAVKDFFTDMAAFLADPVVVSYPGEFTVHDDTGVLIDVIPVTTIPTPSTSIATGSYSAPTGARITWETGDIQAGRRIRGRTFIVPLTGSAYDTDGTLGVGALTGLKNAADTFLATLNTLGSALAVWSQSTSTVNGVVGATIPDQATVLRSRRD